MDMKFYKNLLKNYGKGELAYALAEIHEANKMDGHDEIDALQRIEEVLMEFEPE